MSSTTIRIDDPLLKELRAIAPEGQSVSALIRGILEKEIRHQRMAESAAAYQRFLAEHPDASREMEEWEKASLDQDPKKKRIGF